MEQQIAEIRKKFEDEVSKNSAAYHPIDIERVKTEEWQVKRFLIDQQQNVDAAFEALCKALQWKKEFEIHERTDDYFPKELWEFSKIEVNGTDKDGHLIQWELLKGQKFFKELNLLTKQFIAHVIERVDRMAGEKGYINVIDANGAGVSNLDNEMAKFKIAAIEHYPGGIKKVIYVDLPWLLSPVLNVVLGFMSPKLKSIVEYAKGKELSKYMDEQLVPKCCGGKRTTINTPANLQPMSKIYEKLQLTDKFVDTYYGAYKVPRP